MRSGPGRLVLGPFGHVSDATARAVRDLTICYKSEFVFQLSTSMTHRTWPCRDEFSSLQASCDIVMVPDLVERAVSAVHRDGSTVSLLQGIFNLLKYVGL